MTGFRFPGVASLIPYLQALTSSQLLTIKRLFYKSVFLTSLAWNANLLSLLTILVYNLKALLCFGDVLKSC